MRAGSFIIALFGIALAGGSVWYAKGHLVPAPAVAAVAPAPKPIEMTDVWVAAQDLALGDPITEKTIRALSWPSGQLPKGAITDISVLIGTDPQQPRLTRQRFVEGELILAAKLGDFGEDTSLIRKLGANTRAMALKVDAVTAVGGFVTPGDFVDILLTQGNGAAMRAATILQNIRVIGVDQRVNEDRTEASVARTVTVEVTASDGQRLALAQQAGNLSLSLRTADAPTDSALEQITLNDLLGIEAAPVIETVVEPAPQIRKVRERRGTEQSLVEIN